MAQQGKLKWYNHVKGYGFVARDEGMKDLFVHVSEFRKSGIKKVKENMDVIDNPKYSYLVNCNWINNHLNSTFYFCLT